MKTIIGISGSVRAASFNAALLRAAVEAAPDGCTVEIASIKEIPLYNGDLEANNGIPETVARLKDRIADADGLLLVTPEYNNSVPGVLKNAIDWLSRPAADIPRVFGDKPVAIMGATPGAGATRLAQTAWLPVFRTLGAKVWFGGTLYVAGARKVFDESGNLIDQAITERLQRYMAGFAASLADSG